MKDNNSSNPIQNSKKKPMRLLSFEMSNGTNRDFEPQGVSVLVLEEAGLDRESRKTEISECFAIQNPAEAKNLEKVIDKTAGLSNTQLKSLTNYIKKQHLKADKVDLLDILDEKISTIWLEDQS